MLRYYFVIFIVFTLGLVIWLWPNQLRIPESIDVPATAELSIKSSNLIPETISTTQQIPQTTSSPNSNQKAHSKIVFNDLDPGLQQVLKESLKDNLSLVGLQAQKLADGTVIIPSQGRLQTITVATIDSDGQIQYAEFKETPQIAEPTENNQ